jgi:thiol-disulfide isomerase/thioredoxin
MQRCGACKQLAPHYEALAEKMKGQDVLIAKMDVTTNGIDEKYGLTINSFPTIMFFPALDKQKPVPYSGPKDTEAMAKFVMAELDDEDPGDDEL